MTEEHTCQVKIDTVAPVTTQAGGNSGMHDTPVTVTFSAYDPTRQTARASTTPSTRSTVAAG